MSYITINFLSLLLEWYSSLAKPHEQHSQGIVSTALNVCKHSRITPQGARTNFSI